MGLTGLLLGAGSSYDIGMPLTVELTAQLKDWLTPAKLRSLNNGWRSQDGGYSDATIDDLATVLVRDRMSYEHTIGYLEVQGDRLGVRSQEYHGLRAFLSEMIYVLLKETHVRNVDLITRNLRYLVGIGTLVQENNPLWVFSLNQDLIMECFSAHAKIPIKYGFSEETVKLPRRDKANTVVGQVEARVTRRSQLASHSLSFFQPGQEGINLLKMHGSLDEFAFNDGKDLLKLVPTDRSVLGVISALRLANDEVRYIDPRWPGGYVIATNEIAYEDAEGEMQFLRRTPLAGSHKFHGQSYQTVPHELLTCVGNSLLYISRLICIGYGFGDYHVNQVIRTWLEDRAERRLSIVDPSVGRVPIELIHLYSQIELIESQATDYLDSLAGIERPNSATLERRFSAWRRSARQQAGDLAVKHYLDHLTESAASKAIEWMKTLPWRDGGIEALRGWWGRGGSVVWRVECVRRSGRGRGCGSCRRWCSRSLGV